MRYDMAKLYNKLWLILLDHGYRVEDYPQLNECLSDDCEDGDDARWCIDNWQEVTEEWCMAWLVVNFWMAGTDKGYWASVWQLIWYVAWLVEMQEWCLMSNMHIFDDCADPDDDPKKWDIVYYMRIDHYAKPLRMLMGRGIVETVGKRYRIRIDPWKTRSVKREFVAHNKHVLIKKHVTGMEERFEWDFWE